ncbi:MAG: hypothetical protein KBT75_03570, partial [Oleispira antarctica]|nr:hypothetical protein [Oleispira antarctica]MBQ0791858.1 hypothetical protein [Oleispira antarctica]
MLQGSIVFILVVTGLICVVGAGYLLFRRGWFWTWLKASFAMSLVVCTIIALFSLLDVLSYKQLLSEVPIASISMYEKQPQHFDVSLIATGGEEQRFEIYGDQWQLDARLLTWVGPIAAMGKKPLYRLDRISGRYISLEQARNAEQSIYGLEQSSVIDIWKILQTMPSWIDANYGSAVYMPMEHGAVYSVHLTAKG